ncbi:hypothetical protein C1646_767467 [Rhizophagus diaphanus]|nr:hypothetical protein C1646_767467 [Rhizophagus diaphanus] [Rhizophagus sp. MUCL 43196]
MQMIAPTLAIQPQKDDFKIHQARDLSYSGIVIDDATLENFIYEELQKRLGSKTVHVRKNPFTPRSAYATKKVVRKKSLKTSKKNTDIEEYIVEEEVDPKKEEEDVEYVDNGKSILSTSNRNCYASPIVLKEILIEISKFINTIFSKLKDHCLNTVMPNDTAVNTNQKPLLDVLSEENVKSSIDTMDGTIVNNSENHQETAPSHILNHAIMAYTQHGSAEKKSDIVHIYWPKPLEINFLQIKDADDIVTISCKVGGMTIPYAMIDSGSDSSIVSENVAKYLGLKIDRKKVHRLNGVVSKSHSLGTVDSVPVTIDDGENRDTIPDEFSVIPTEYDDNGKELSLFILGTQWQYRAGWEPLVKGEFRVVPEISQQCSLVQEISLQSSVVPEIFQQYLEKNMVPIRLSLA